MGEEGGSREGEETEYPGGREAMERRRRGEGSETCWAGTVRDMRRREAGRGEGMGIEERELRWRRGCGLACLRGGVWRGGGA